MLAGRLTNKGIKAKPYHAGMYNGLTSPAFNVVCFVVVVVAYCCCLPLGLGAAKRSTVQQQWMDGVVPVIVATISFGMGVDKANVR